MYLKIFFYRDKDSKEPFCKTQTPIDDGLEDGNRNLIHFSEGTWGVKGPVADCVYLEAQLERVDHDENLDSLYQLQLAYRPDYEPQTDAVGMFVTWGRDDKGNKVPVFRMQMLRGASGESVLRLLRRTNKTEEFTWLTIAEFDIDVSPNPTKKLLLDSMVDEMLGVNPFAVLSKFEGLSKTNIKEEWFLSETASSLRDVERQIYGFEKVVTLLRPHLLDIVSRCAGIVVRTYQRINQERIRKITPKTRRDMDRRLLMGISHGRACAPVLSMSYDMPIHRATKGFLLYFKNCVADLISKLNDSVTKDANRLSEMPDVDRFLRRDILLGINFKQSLLDRAGTILGECRRFLSEECPWMQCRGDVVGTIDYLATVEVPNTEAYKCAHMVMLDFMKWRDFRGRLNGCFRLPKFVRDSDDGECSTWQKNYSFIYEAWVFKRLVQAFMNEGFKELGTNYAQQVAQSIKNVHLGPVFNEPICARLEPGDSSLKVELYGGIRAYPDGTLNIRGFTSHFKKPHLSTPDYAIVFYNDNSPSSQYWIVLDAKSGMSLDVGAVEARDKYMKVVWFNGKKPNQSWIIYSGPKDDVAEIEFNPDEMEQANPPWTEKLRRKDTSPLAENTGVSFTRYGLSGGKTDDRYVGHVRANVNSIKVCDIFSEFAKGQIEIAKKTLLTK